mgnify:CR=1 FL=1|jgi:hypothetical protein
MTTTVTWTGDDQIRRNIAIYGQKVKQAVVSIARYFEPILESHAKEHAIWTDRTGNARQGLYTATDVAEDVVKLYLSHTMDYGLALETRYSGKYAIIWPTIQEHLEAIKQMLDDTFK